ncbi:DUF406 family protein [Edwardsiella ictaluri]|uniref:DUF406 family protein n=1 Tax=Edwardsiella ictaluri TaxID=67780 RepID=UPI001E60C298|nr:DUF406 family protein [Edwardsiella ictaluri]
MLLSACALLNGFVSGSKSQRVAQQEYPCIITHDICEKEGEFILNVHFNFSCQAETVIFELSLRHA